MSVITGTDDSESLPGTAGNDTIIGLGGDDTLTGGLGIDSLDGGAGNDVLVVAAQAELGAGEVYRGGLGIDKLDIQTSSAVDLSAVTLAADIEQLESDGAVSLSAAQLDAFTSVATGAITLSSGGAVNLTDAEVYTHDFTLNAAGNTLNLSGVLTNWYNVNGGAGNDIVVGGDQSDILSGAGGNDNLVGGAGDDWLTGGIGKDTVNGGIGNDRLIVNGQAELTAAESFIGGTGTDKLDIETGSAVNLTAVSIATDIEQLESNGAVALTAAQLDAFKSVATGAITLTTTGAVNLTDAAVFTHDFNLNAAGNTLNLGGVTTTWYNIVGGAAADSIVGGEQADAIAGNGGNDTVLGGDGNDQVTGGAGNDVLNGGNGGDILVGGIGMDTVNGAAGDDRFDIGGQADLVAGESFIGGAGMDEINIQSAAAVDLSTVTLATDIEMLESNVAVSLKAAQLDAFKVVGTGPITLTSAGAVNLTDAAVYTHDFSLSAAGNTLNLSGVLTNWYHVVGGAGNDIILGGAQGDDLNGGAGADNVVGGAGDDVLTGGAGKDTVNGGVGADRLVVNDPAELVAGESYVGGTGVDKLDFETSNPVNLSGITIAADIEQLESNGAVSLNAAQLDAFKSVATGAITLNTIGAVDLTDAAVFTRDFHLNAGGNTLNVGGVTSNWYNIAGDAAGDSIVGGDNGSGDSIDGAGGNDTIIAGAGNDTVVGGAGNDSLNGGDGADQLTGGAGADTVNGAAGDDRFIVNSQAELSANEQLIGGAGTDKLDLETSNAVNLSAVVISGIEQLESSGAVSLTAAQLDAFTSVGTGPITLTTTGVVNLTDAAVYTHDVNLNAGGNTLNLGGVLTNWYNIIGGAAADSVIGGDQGDAIAGNGGNDTLLGGGGGDVLTGGLGADVANGGSGDDRFVVNGQADLAAGDTFLGGTGIDKLDLETASAVNLTGFSIGTDIEQLESNGSVSLTAAQLDPFLSVNTGAITLTTSGTVDLSNADVFTRDFNLNAAGNTLNLGGISTNWYNVAGGASADSIFGGDNGSGDILNGNGGNDTIVGGAGNDQLLGGSENDNLVGGAGQDQLTGGIGIDVLNGGAGNDRFIVNSQAELGASESYTGGAGTDKLDLETGAAINLSAVTIAADIEQLESGGAVSLTAAQLDAFNWLNTGAITITNAGVVNLTGASLFMHDFSLSAAGNTLNLTGVTSNGFAVNGGAAADSVIGGDRADNLVGGGGNDSLIGGGGADILTGGLNNDSLTGGSGNDRFVFAPGSGQDTVSGFHHGTAANPEQDKLDLTVFHFASNADALSHASSSGGNTFFDLDGNAATHEITLLGVSSVDANDILI